MPDVAEAAWTEWRLNRYIDPALDTPALRVVFLVGYRRALLDAAEHIGDDWCAEELRAWAWAVGTKDDHT